MHIVVIVSTISNVLMTNTSCAYSGLRIKFVKDSMICIPIAICVLLFLTLFQLYAIALQIHMNKNTVNKYRRPFAKRVLDPAAAKSKWPARASAY